MDRAVVVIGQRLHDNSGKVVATQGYYIDATPRANSETEISDRVAEISDNRAAMSRPKGS